VELFFAWTARSFAQNACAKFDDAFAYNQCLASQGPKAHATRSIDVPAGESAGAQGLRRGRVHTSLEVFRRRNGRMIAEFTVAPPLPKRQKRPEDP